MALDAQRIWKKDPAAELTVGLWWEDVIVRGDTLASVSWTVPTGLTKLSEGVNTAAIDDAGTIYPIGTVALLRLSGGVADLDYDCVCQVTTGNGDIDERTLTVMARER